MSQADLARIAGALHGLVHGPGIDLGYALTLAGLALLGAFAVAATALLAVRLAKAIWNASPRGLLAALFVGAWVLLAAGLLLP
ncbi:MAG: hypothetical protein LRS49_05985 [Desulfurococcales archaeon]|nr:hypothetical protein [Desulfurococcales archaeon]